MNLHQHIIPAGLAAISHLALLLSGGGAPAGMPLSPPKDPTAVRELPLELHTPPEPEELPDNNDVKPIKGDPPPPDLPELMNTDRVADIAVMIEPQQVRPQTTNETPRLNRPGDPLGDPNGSPLRTQVTFYPPDRLDNIPRAKSQLPPAYPQSMKHSGITGEVWVEFDVDLKGRVVGARVQKSTDRAFEEPTLRAVMKWRFEPGRKGGMPVPFRMLIPVSFTLDNH